MTTYLLSKNVDYPREIYLDQETEDQLAAYIESELQNHYMERGDHVNDLLRWQKDYWAKPTTEQATFPFKGAATLVIPLSAIAVETTHARSMTTLFGLKQFVSATAISPDWDPVTKALERFLDRELLYEMNFQQNFGDVILEAEKYGTGIGKSSYTKTVRTAIREIGGVEQEFDIVTRQGACFDAAADARFLMPFSEQDPQTSPWVGEEHSASPYALQQMEAAGMFRPNTIINQPGWETDPNKQSKLHPYTISSTTVGNQGATSGVRFTQNQAELEKTKPSLPRSIEWIEWWGAFNVDKDPTGRLKEIVVHFHRESKTFMSIRYNWHHDLRRPWRMTVYMPVEHRGRGIGLCKMNEQFQREITTQHRQRLDNATLANMRMIKVSKLSGYGPKEPIFPGKMWFLDDMTHLDTVQMGEIYPSAFANEQSSLLYSQQRTGASDLTSGLQQSGTPGTATSDLARLKEANKKFDFIFGNFKNFGSKVIGDIVCNIQQFGPRRITYYDVADGGQLVKQFFEMPDELVRNGLLFDIRTVGEQSNDIVDRQNWQQVAALLQQYYAGVIQLAMPLGNPQLLSAIFSKGLGAATEAMRQVLETYNIRNIDRLIVKELEALSGAPQGGLPGNGSQPAPSAGGDRGVNGSNQAAGMDVLAKAFSLAGANGNGAANRISGY